MFKYLIVMLCAVWSTAGWANDYPAVPEGGIRLIASAPCTDAETGQKGNCQVYQGADGTFYTTFWQDETMMFIRKPTEDGYETIWVNDRYNSI